jgi:hypothetical protein
MIARQISMRPQDVVVLLKIVCFKKNNKTWLRKDIAAGLDLSNSEITNVFERLRATGLIDVSRNTVHTNAFYEFLVYGLKVAFPPYIGAETRGVLTGVNAFADSGIKGANYVWEYYEGKQRGTVISPLYPEVVHAVQKDEFLYHALCACDMLRVGQTREISFARKWLRDFLND